MLSKREVPDLQITKAVSGAVVGLRDQLEALTILDETALTWPGLSLVCMLVHAGIGAGICISVPSRRWKVRVH